MAKLLEITGKAVSGEWGQDDDTGTGIPVLRTTNFTNEGFVNYKNVVTRSISKKNIAEKYLRHGDIIIEKSGGSDKQPVGRVIFFEGEENKYLFNNFTGLLRIQNQEEWLPKYVFYALYAYYSNGGTRAFENRTTGLHNLQVDNYVKSVDIPKLSYRRQQHICETLDHVCNAVAYRERQLTKLDELIKARFVEMFGDPVNNPLRYSKVQLGKVCDVRDGTHDSPAYHNEGYPLVTSKNVTSGKIDLSTCNLISESDYEKICARSKADIGDIIMPMIGTVGKPVIVNTEQKFAIKNVALIKFHDDSPVLNTYIKALLESDYFDRAVINKVRGGTQKFIALGDIRKLEIVLADLKYQKNFSIFVGEVDKQKQNVQQSLDKLELLKNALMQEYFG